MFWSFTTVCFPAWPYVDASYRGPAWRRWVFKSITLILLPLLAWQVPMFNAISYPALAGLCTSLPGGTLAPLSRQRMMYAVDAFLLPHLLYTIWFTNQLALSFSQPLPLVLLVFGALLVVAIWSRLEGMKMSTLTFIEMTPVVIWLAGELWFARPTNTALSGFAGAALPLLSNTVWLVSHYRRRLRVDNTIATAFYFVGHSLIVRALYL